MTHEEYESKSQMKRVEILKAGEKQMIHEELLDKIEAIDYWQEHLANRTFLKALRAVVELHQPIYTFIADSDKSIPLCIQCRDGDFIADYPCNTIQAIEKELM